MKDRIWAKRFAKYYEQCKLPVWATVFGIILLVIGLVGAGITAIFHDKYFSVFGMWDIAHANVWFMVFL